MKFFKLNDLHQPDDTIKDFYSLVWVERYRESGDFQLVVENEVSVLDQFPKGILVSHTDTTEVMIVENHEIFRDADKKLLITISGRSFETFSENRTTVGSDIPLYDPVTDEANADLTVVSPACDIAVDLLKIGLEPGTASAADEIPNLLVYDDIAVYDPAMEYVIKRGQVYPRVIEFLNICGAGIKTIRPNGVQTTMDLVIHDGTDLSLSITFYAQDEDLEDARYFWSIKGYKNYAKIAAHSYARVYRHRDLLSDLNGLQRRTLYVEADDIEGDYDPPSASDVISSRAQMELDGRKETSLIQSRISKTAKPKFKIDYDVGDLVTVSGEFSIVQTMRVTEHILTIDKDGMRGYPSLSAL